MARKMTEVNNSQPQSLKYVQMWQRAKTNFGTLHL